MAIPLMNPSLWKMAAQDLRSDNDLTTEDLHRLLDLAQQVKRTPKRFANSLKSRYLTLLFEKPSLRTRMTFELAIKQLGADCVVSTGPIGEREPLKDVARNLDRWTNGIVARVFSQQTIDELASWSNVPVINALSDQYHPCQALADFQTIKEKFGRFRGVKLAFVGDGNNVAHSLMLNAARLGVDFTIAAPRGYAAAANIVEQAREYAGATGSKIEETQDPFEAVSGAHAVYTDVWASMGQEHEAAERQSVFSAYQVNEALMGGARQDAVFMHCLPAKRGQETTDGVMESANSVIFDQAENRLHAQKALLLMLLQ
ncbi:MAG TPA: ornithine carbamoyltransferase [Bryobacteraceae bacterium]|nr:ornithine carbamoyltransferase [Bryobacteraceae bacterium]